MKALGLSMLAYGTVFFTYVMLTPGDQLWQAIAGGLLIGLGAAVAAD